jgi:hypothetical protein
MLEGLQRDSRRLARLLEIAARDAGKDLETDMQVAEELARRIAEGVEWMRSGDRRGAEQVPDLRAGTDGAGEADAGQVPEVRVREVASGGTGAEPDGGVGEAESVEGVTP